MRVHERPVFALRLLLALSGFARMHRVCAEAESKHLGQLRAQHQGASSGRSSVSPGASQHGGSPSQGVGAEVRSGWGGSSAPPSPWGLGDPRLSQQQMQPGSQPQMQPVAQQAQGAQQGSQQQMQEQMQPVAQQVLEEEVRRLRQELRLQQERAGVHAGGAGSEGPLRQGGAGGAGSEGPLRQGAESVRAVQHVQQMQMGSAGQVQPGAPALPPRTHLVGRTCGWVRRGADVRRARAWGRLPPPPSPLPFPPEATVSKTEQGALRV